MNNINQRPALNADQQTGLAEIGAFLISAKKEFFLTGAPGVGKTFTTKEIVLQIPHILSSYCNAMGKAHIDKEIILTSTTNKAAAVLSTETNLPATTIHSFLGVVPKNNFKTGRTTLTKNSKWRVHSNIVLIVDEAPMAGTKLYNLINEATDSSCKIIYIGDKNQLAPVMEKVSPVVLLAESPETHYTITTPVRNSESPALMDLCNRLRADIENGVTDKNQMTHWHEVPGQIEWLDGPQLEHLVTKTFGPGGIVQPGDTELKGRILCYTNKSVIGYNQHIRSIRNLPMHPTPGETLVANRHIEIGRGRIINVEEDVLITDVNGPGIVSIDTHNDLSAYELEISSPFAGRAGVMIPEHMHQYTMLANHFKKHKDWYNFYKLQEQFVDLRDREASTVYKAQGSTYEFVIMIMNDIFTSRDVSQLLRMLYVGASRAKRKVYVYDKDIHNKPRSIYQ